MTSTPMSPGRAMPTKALRFAPSQYTWPPFPWTIRAISTM